MRSVMINRTTTIPRHCSRITRRTRRYGCAAVAVRTLPLIEGRAELLELELSSINDCRYTLMQ